MIIRCLSGSIRLVHIEIAIYDTNLRCLPCSYTLGLVGDRLVEGTGREGHRYLSLSKSCIPPRLDGGWRVRHHNRSLSTETLLACDAYIEADDSHKGRVTVGHGPSYGYRPYRIPRIPSFVSDLDLCEVNRYRAAGTGGRSGLRLGDLSGRWRRRARLVRCRRIHRAARSGLQDSPSKKRGADRIDGGHGPDGRQRPAGSHPPREAADGLSEQAPCPAGLAEPAARSGCGGRERLVRHRLRPAAQRCRRRRSSGRCRPSPLPPGSRRVGADGARRPPLELRRAGASGPGRLRQADGARPSRPRRCDAGGGCDPRRRGLPSPPLPGPERVAACNHFATQPVATGWHQAPLAGHPRSRSPWSGAQTVTGGHCWTPPGGGS